jgi:hypothetical protein
MDGFELERTDLAIRTESPIMATHDQVAVPVTVEVAPRVAAPEVLHRRAENLPCVGELVVAGMGLRVAVAGPVGEFHTRKAGFGVSSGLVWDLSPAGRFRSPGGDR